MQHLPYSRFRRRPPRPCGVGEEDLRYGGHRFPHLLHPPGQARWGSQNPDATGIGRCTLIESPELGIPLRRQPAPVPVRHGMCRGCRRGRAKVLLKGRQVFRRKGHMPRHKHRRWPAIRQELLPRPPGHSRRHRQSRAFPSRAAMPVDHPRHPGQDTRCPQTRSGRPRRRVRRG